MKFTELSGRRRPSRPARRQAAAIRAQAAGARQRAADTGAMLARGEGNAT